MAANSCVTSSLSACQGPFLAAKQSRGRCKKVGEYKTIERSTEKRLYGLWPPHRTGLPCCRCKPPSEDEGSNSNVQAAKTTRRRALIAETVAGREARSKPRSQGPVATEAPERPLRPDASRRSLLLFAAGVVLSAQLADACLAEPVSSQVSESTSEPGSVRKKLDAARKGRREEDTVNVEVYKGEKQPVTKAEVLDDYEKKLLTYNRKIQKQNNAPRDFPGFIREGYDVRVVTSPDYKTSSSGLLYKDYDEGSGPQPEEGQQVVFHYTGYNESGKRVDSSYQQNRPSETRIGINGMIPGFEEGIKSMRVGGKRRVIVPPDLGPPTGPSTFFSAKQFEVFDIELLGIKNCKRRQIGFYSDLVCDDVIAEIPAELK